MRIYLVGYMASGKSSFGQLLAGQIGYEFVDLDLVFEQRFRISIADFFQKYDEQAFRQIEHTLLLDTEKLENTVISTGGGTPCYFDNLKIIKSLGCSVYLKWGVSALAERLKVARKKRPLVKHVPTEELESKISDHLSERDFYYRQADLTVQCENAATEQLILQIIDYFGIPDIKTD